MDSDAAGKLDSADYRYLAVSIVSEEDFATIALDDNNWEESCRSFNYQNYLNGKPENSI